ncbi:conserved membrane protein of unknown function [Rhodovastum atsumiense]|uniref:Uncharacterized protein n=1 Tax=Rhodovastum atsumiense TaxID=504468 RepID=A0A5M6J1Z0_9PROT|nr:hypothetical protein [Rhodovastum atsumiense]KAA5614249.1 hypothetical protein F1189_01230 [Rhodovastum atsumiense]CAH2604699.1 conserved membrane protein of unknown function [Rhodovastum atsumiense]
MSYLKIALTVSTLFGLAGVVAGLFLPQQLAAVNDAWLATMVLATAYAWVQAKWLDPDAETALEAAKLLSAITVILFVVPRLPHSAVGNFIGHLEPAAMTLALNLIALAGAGVLTARAVLAEPDAA